MRPSLRRFLLFGVPQEAYLLRDDFTVNVAAGSLNGTLATPGPGIRSVVDTESKMSISGGELTFAGRASPGWGDPRINYPVQARVAGKMLFNRSKSVAYYTFGYGSNPLGQPYQGAINFDASAFWMANENSAGPFIYYPIIGKIYSTVLIQRAAGMFFFVYDAVPRLYHHSQTYNGASLYPSIATYNGTVHHKTIRIPVNRWLPMPLISDGFSAATSDGLGHPEGVTGGIGAGGNGAIWTDALGTFAAAGGVLTCSALSGGVGLRITTLPTSHVIASAKVYRTAGVAGLIFHYIDANNFSRVVLDGTNMVYSQVVAGVSTDIATVAVTYVDGAVLMVICDSGYIRFKYNGVVVSSNFIYPYEYNMPGKSFGFYTTDTGNTWDDYQVYACGNEGQYTNLFKYLPQMTPSMNILLVGDSKTEYAGLMCLKMSTDIVQFYKVNDPLAHGGYTVALVKAGIDQWLTCVGYPPQALLINLGVNDAGTLPAEVTWKANYQYILDAIHTKFPGASIYLMRIWCRGLAAHCATLNGWIGDLVTLNSTFVHLGPDESVFLENGDDGVTYTADGIHPNAAGYQLTADKWRETLGY
jgi:lysophospholipase L1-like esterase